MEERQQNDHDLLIEINTKLTLLISQYSETVKDIARLDMQKQDKAESNKMFGDHELRIRRSERLLLIGIGGLMLLQILMGFNMIK